MNDGIVVVTGAAGFVGRALCAHLAALSRAHRGIVRVADHALPGTEQVAIGDLATASDAELAATVAGATAVVHLAGRAHVMRERRADAAARYHAANVVATERLARAARQAGVMRFVLASTIKVHGETTSSGRPFRADDPLAPQDAYGRSKAAAEAALAAACADTPMAPIVLRLPLVYGPRVKGNFLALVDAVARRARLPFAGIANRRDLLYVGNLAHAIVRLLDDPEPPSGPWLVADGEAMSTPELVRHVAAALSIEPHLVKVPVPLLSLGGWLTRRRSMVDRLVSSLEVDAAPLRRRIGVPPFTIEQGLADTAAWWRGRHAI